MCSSGIRSRNIPVSLAEEQIYKINGALGRGVRANN